MRILLSPIAFARETFSASVKPSAGDAAEFQLSFTCIDRRTDFSATPTRDSYRAIAANGFVPL
jgi:hypothetical protein